MREKSETKNDAAGGEVEPASSFSATRALIRKARDYHRLRFWRQFSFWSVTLGAAAVCYPVEKWLTAAPDTSCTTLATCVVTAHVVLDALPALILLIFLIYHLAREYQAGIDWRDAVKSIGSFAKHEVVTQGFDDFFDIYIRSKRRSYHLLSAGLLALAYGGVGGWLAAGHGAATAPLMIVAMAEVVLAGAMLLMSYKIARNYLPGQIVVEHILLLCTIALQKDINIAEAREIVARDMRQFIERKPWWFYN